MSITTDTSKLDDLITTTLDSANGYERSAQDALDGRFATFFADMARERQAVVAALQAHSQSLGGSPTEQGSVAAAIHRRWEDLRTALGGGDKAVMQEVERGEDYLKEEYDRALKDTNISEATRAVIAQAYESVRRGHDTASRLKHELADAS